MKGFNFWEWDYDEDREAGTITAVKCSRYIPGEYLVSAANYLNDAGPYDEQMMRDFELTWRFPVPESVKDTFRSGVFIRLGMASRGIHPSPWVDGSTDLVQSMDS